MIFWGTGISEKLIPTFSLSCGIQVGHILLIENSINTQRKNKSK